MTSRIVIVLLIIFAGIAFYVRSQRTHSQSQTSFTPSEIQQLTEASDSVTARLKQCDTGFLNADHCLRKNNGWQDGISDRKEALLALRTVVGTWRDGEISPSISRRKLFNLARIDTILVLDSVISLRVNAAQCRDNTERQAMYAAIWWLYGTTIRHTTSHILQFMSIRASKLSDSVQAASYQRIQAYTTLPIELKMNETEGSYTLQIDMNRRAPFEAKYFSYKTVKSAIAAFSADLEALHLSNSATTH